MSLTEAAFDRALAERDISATQEDRDAAFTIACYLDNCARLLREAADKKTEDAK